MAEGCMIILKNYIDLRRHKALFHPRSSSSIGAQKTRKRSHSLSIYDENEEYNETNCNEFIAASSDQGFTDNPSEFSPGQTRRLVLSTFYPHSPFAYFKPLKIQNFANLLIPVWQVFQQRTSYSKLRNSLANILTAKDHFLRKKI